MRILAAVILALLGIVELILRGALMVVLVCTIIGIIVVLLDDKGIIIKPICFDLAGRVLQMP